ncbi:MAG: tryptophan 7-halogenase [Gemmatimonadota bacterium]
MRLRAEGLSRIPAPDVLVLGGGPAGCAAALVLASGGHAVALVRPERPPGASLAQSIPPSARALLGELGMLDAIERAGFVPNRGNTAAWAGSPVRAEVFPDGGHGFHVDRAGLERALDAVIEQAGVTVVRGPAARFAERSGGAWHLRCLDPTGRTVRISAPWVVDATGRHGFFARKLGREPDRRTTTIALVSRVPEEEARSDHDGHTLIESYEDGWAWSVPVGPGARCVTAMVDPRETPIDADSLGGTLARQLRKAPLIESISGPGRRHPDAWACPASLYTSARYTDEGLVVAGDAGAFIDPLSSYGVKKALVSGRLAGIAIATCLEDASMTGAALAYHDAHERDVAATYRARSADFFAEAAARYGHPFWSRRLEAAQSTASPRASEPSPTELAVAEADVRRAHAALRAAPRLRARPGATLRTITAPALAGRRIVLENHLASDLHPRPARFHRSVDLRRLVALAPRHHAVPELWSAYNRSGPPADLPDFLTALAAACAAGFLSTEEA